MSFSVLQKVLISLNDFKVVGNILRNSASIQSIRWASSAPEEDEVLPKKNEEPQKPHKNVQNSFPSDYRFVYPEFLPDPSVERRNFIREKLERMDMLKRRSNIDIPEFYVGTIMAVTRSNKHAPNNSARFLGICIQRSGEGLRASFVLRNVIDHLGVEMKFYLYDPTLIKIEVLRLEKRLDDELFYLRDSLPEYSTFPLDMEPEMLPEGSSVPVNHIKVKLKPRPWCQRWERSNLKGLANVEEHISEKMKQQAAKLKKPWEKWDLMAQYRRTIPEEEQKEIYAEVHSELHQVEMSRKRMKKKQIFVKPKKTG